MVGLKMIFFTSLRGWFYVINYHSKLAFCGGLPWPIHESRASYPHLVGDHEPMASNLFHQPCVLNLNLSISQ